MAVYRCTPKPINKIKYKCTEPKQMQKQWKENENLAARPDQ